jgi:hypothetical protein
MTALSVEVQAMEEMTGGAGPAFTIPHSGNTKSNALFCVFFSFKRHLRSLTTYNSVV